MLLNKLKKLKGLKGKRLSVRSTLTILGVFLILISGGYRLQQRALSFNVIPSSGQASSFSTSEIPASIDIPKRGINLNIKPAEIREGQWGISADTASYLTQSSAPGKGGNIVIYAHNKKELFGNLLNTEYGDIIHVRTNDGVIQEYQVRKKFIVSPDKIDVVEPTSYEVLTLFTCVGFADSQRLIIQAYPLS